MKESQDALLPEALFTHQYPSEITLQTKHVFFRYIAFSNEPSPNQQHYTGFIMKQAEGNTSYTSNMSDDQNTLIYYLRTKLFCVLTYNNLVLK